MTGESVLIGSCRLEMAPAAKRPANEPLTGLFVTWAENTRGKSKRERKLKSEIKSKKGESKCKKIHRYGQVSQLVSSFLI